MKQQIVSICVHPRVCPCPTAGMLALRRSFSDGWHRNFQCCPSVPVWGLLFIPRAARPHPSCSTASTPPALWQGCDIAVPGALCPVQQRFWWWRGWVGAGWGLGEAPLVLELLQELDTRRGSTGIYPSLCCACKQGVFAHPAAGHGVPGAWKGSSGCWNCPDPAHPFSPACPLACVKLHKVSPEREFKMLSDLTTSF